MNRRMLKAIVFVYALSLMVNVAQADILPGGFEFAFANDALTSIFLGPFGLSGCPLG